MAISYSTSCDIQKECDTFLPRLDDARKSKNKYSSKSSKSFANIKQFIFVALPSRIFAKKMLQFADVSWASTVSLFTAVIYAAVLSKYLRYWTRQLDIEKNSMVQKNEKT
jgi:hypothetical protein